jgi:hypothetical protein
MICSMVKLEIPAIYKNSPRNKRKEYTKSGTRRLLVVRFGRMAGRELEWLGRTLEGRSYRYTSDPYWTWLKTPLHFQIVHAKIPMQ